MRGSFAYNKFNTYNIAHGSRCELPATSYMVSGIDRLLSTVTSAGFPTPFLFKTNTPGLFFPDEGILFCDVQQFLNFVMLMQELGTLPTYEDLYVLDSSWVNYYNNTPVPASLMVGVPAYQRYVFRFEYIGGGPFIPGDPGAVNPLSGAPGFLYLQRFDVSLAPYYSQPISLLPPGGRIDTCTRQNLALQQFNGFTRVNPQARDQVDAESGAVVIFSYAFLNSGMFAETEAFGAPIDGGFAASFAVLTQGAFYLDFASVGSVEFQVAPSTLGTYKMVLYPRYNTYAEQAAGLSGLQTGYPASYNYLKQHSLAGTCSS
jgi:hypothetical protein